MTPCPASLADCHRCIVSKRLGSPYRSGRSPHWVKIKNPNAPAVKREAEEDWGALTLYDDNKTWRITCPAFTFLKAPAATMDSQRTQLEAIFRLIKVRGHAFATSK